MEPSSYQIMVTTGVIIGIMVLMLKAKKKVILSKDDRDLKYEMKRKERSLVHEGPSHVIHALLTLFTGGMWAFVWIIVALMSRSKKKALRRDIDNIERELTIREGA